MEQSTAADPTEGRRLTPMLQQYVDAKKDCPPDCILMFRMGDFFELFFEDARLAAKELDITLTSREKGSDPIPMAGVPHHAITGYITKLVQRGYSVALCDQVEDPKQAKGLVKRAITQLITPGTVSDIEALDPGATSYLTYVGPSVETERFVVVFLDLLAGEIVTTECAAEKIGDECHRMGAKEVVSDLPLPSALEARLKTETIPTRRLSTGPMAPKEASQAFAKRFESRAISGFNKRHWPHHHAAIERLLLFAEETQRRPLKHLTQPRGYRITDYLVLDECTRRNLELVRTQRDQRREGSVLWHLDKCRTAIGSRLLAQWLLFPLRDKDLIDQRLDSVEALKNARTLREDIQKELEPIRDIERLVGRIAVGRANPRDLVSLRASLSQSPTIKKLLAAHGSPLGSAWAEADEVADVQHLLANALADDVPISTTDGGIFRLGYRPELDTLIRASTEGHDFLSALEARERQRTDIPNLKVRYNKVFGYFIEVTRAHLNNVPADYIRKQTLVNAERFITDELKKFETTVLGADGERKAREYELFGDLVQALLEHIPRLRALSRLVARTDATLSLGQVADQHRYTRPTLADSPRVELEACRHPVVERLMPRGERFVPNDIVLDPADRRMMIVTGPNMGGKSTVMRQVALAHILAQMGSFVPAKTAHLGICDRIFTRVGASDDLGRGQSTFMVEMIETATILKEAGPRSLVILDEIGRGTSTFDGVSIAWSVAEHLYEHARCLTMFATHYHELTSLAENHPGVINACVTARQQQEGIVFLRKLQDGAANRSYGIQVAGLAGVPKDVLTRASAILDNLEGRTTPSKIGEGSQIPAPAPQLALFAPPDQETMPKPVPQESQVDRDLRELDVMNLTPIDALNTLHRLKNKLDESF